MLFINTQRIKPYLESIREYLQNTQPDEQVWTLFKIQEIFDNQLVNSYRSQLTYKIRNNMIR